MRLLPPLPPGDYSRPLKSHREVPIPFWGAPAGYCRWCGQDIGARTKSGEVSRAIKWHTECSTEWARRQPPNQRRATWQAALGECAECGRFCPEYLSPRAEPAPPPRSLAELLQSYTMRPEAKRYFRTWEADHIVPLAAGGTHDPDNLQLLCRPCHSEKTSGEAGTRRAINLTDDVWRRLVDASAWTGMSVSDLTSLAIRDLLDKRRDAA